MSNNTSWLDEVDSSFLDEVDAAFDQPAPAVSSSPSDAYARIVARRQQRKGGGSRHAADEEPGAFDALMGGFKRTAKGLETMANVVTGDDAGVYESTQAAEAIPNTPDQQAFMLDLKRRMETEGDVSVWQAVKNVAGATWANPTGAYHEMVAQLPNSGVVLGGMYAGAQGGAAIGTLVAPGAGTVVGGLVGGITGMFLGNTAIEGGFIAQEQVREGEYDREDVLAKSAIKGGFITGVDVFTMGANRALFGAGFRATEKALAGGVVKGEAGQAVASKVKEVMMRHGVNPADQTAAIAAMSTNRQMMKEIREEGAAAFWKALPKKQRAAMAAAGITLESFGEGLGEYGGSALAGLDASLTEAVLEATMSLPQSAAETAVGAGLAKYRGQIAPPLSGAHPGAQDDAAPGDQPAGAPQPAPAQSAGGAPAAGMPPSGQTVPPAPEPQQTLDAQLQAVIDGRKPAMLVTPGAQIPENLPTEFAVADLGPETGYLIFPRSRPELLEAAKAGQLGDVLGYGTNEKPAGATDVVTATDANGQVIQDVVTGGSPEIEAAAEQVAGPGGSVTQRPAEEAIAQRMQEYEAEKANLPPPRRIQAKALLDRLRRGELSMDQYAAEIAKVYASAAPQGEAAADPAPLSAAPEVAPQDTDVAQGFTPTHELSDGTQVMAAGEPGLWVDADGNEIEDNYAESREPHARQPWELTRSEFENRAAYQGINAATDESNPSYWFTNQSDEAREFAEGQRGDGSVVPLTDPRIDIAIDDLGVEWQKSERKSGSLHAYTGVSKNRPIVASIPLSAASDPHRFLVEQALKNGRRVPDDVIRDYPDLVEFKGRDSSGRYVYQSKIGQFIYRFDESIGVSEQPQETPSTAVTPEEKAELTRDRRQHDIPVEHDRREGDRRQDAGRRKRVDEMTDEEKNVALLTNRKTGLPNDRAYEESTKKNFQGFIDVDGLKWINDNLTHDAGDALLEHVGQALQKEFGVDAYHISGDEFVVQGAMKPQMEAKLRRVLDALAEVTIEADNDRGETFTIKGLGFSYGIDKELATADQISQRHKQERTEAGLRAGRGEQPPGISRKDSGKDRSDPGDSAEEETITADEFDDILNDELAAAGIEDETQDVDAAAHEAATSPNNDLPEPTPAQKEAENYKVGSLRLHGLDISIENPRDSYRFKVDQEKLREIVDHLRGPKGSGYAAANQIADMLDAALSDLEHNSTVPDSFEKIEKARQIAQRKIGAVEELIADVQERAWHNKMPHHYGRILRTEGADGDHVDVFVGPDAENPDLKVFVIDQKDPKTGKFDEHKVMLGFDGWPKARQGYLASYAKGWKGLGGYKAMSLDEFKEWLAGDTTKALDTKDSADTEKPDFTPDVKTDAHPFKVYYRDMNHVLWGIPYAMRPGQQPADIRQESRKDWVRLSGARFSGNKSLDPFEAEANAIRELGYPGGWVYVSEIGAAETSAEQKPVIYKIGDYVTSSDPTFKGKTYRVDLVKGSNDAQTLVLADPATKERVFGNLSFNASNFTKAEKPAKQAETVAAESDDKKEDRGAKEKAAEIEARKDQDAQDKGDGWIGGTPLARAIFRGLVRGDAPKDNNALKRLVTEIDGEAPNALRMKEAQEDYEAALSQRARHIATLGRAMRQEHGDRLGDEMTFKALLSLYEQQPNLNLQTTSSSNNQAYSTPAPIAFLAGRMAGIVPNARVWEPTAGNAMLVMDAERLNTFVNEIEERRYNALRAMGFTYAYQTDATAGTPPLAANIDVVIMNPPFGPAKEPFEIDGYTLTKIDHVIAAKQLAAMRAGGRAVLILGANKKAGDIQQSDRIFFNWLYENYTVDEHFEVSGDLYSRQGAGWPIRIIVISGRAKSDRVSPVSGTIQRVESYDELFNRYLAYQYGVVVPSAAGRPGQAAGAGGAAGGRGDAAGADGVPGPSGDAAPGSDRPGREESGAGGDRGSAGERGERADDGRPGFVGGVDRGDGSDAGADRGRDGRDPGTAGTAGSGDAGRADAGRGPGEAAGDPGADLISADEFDAILEEELAAAGVTTPKRDDRKAENIPGYGWMVPMTSASEQADAVLVDGHGWMVPVSALEKQAPPPPKTPPKTPKGNLKTAATETVAAFGDAFAGLDALFGGKGKLGSGLSFDEETYAKAKPLFKQAVEHALAAGKALKEAVREMIQMAIKQWGAAVKPYLQRFSQEIQAGKVKFERPKKDEAAATELQAPYQGKSQSPGVKILTPVNQSQAIKSALDHIEETYGDIDEFLMKELGYRTREALYEAFMGHQVDGVALAIHQIKTGGALIIGDQTGVGKGRQAAAVIRWAKRNGFTPIFITAKPTLYSDMWGDMVGIGSNDIEPFITNKDEAVIDVNGDRLFTNSGDAKKHASMLNKISGTGELPDGKGVLFTTYDQLQPMGESRTNPRQAVIEALAPRAVFILDEAHKGAGSSGVGQFIRSVLESSRRALYLSATYAKRPDNMPLYFLTDMSKAAETMDELVSAVNAGGVPLMEIVSSQLATAGQFVRRELSWEGISLPTWYEDRPEVNERNAKISDKVTEALRAIVDADRLFHEIALPGIIKDIQGAGGNAASAGNKADKSVTHVNFTAVTHNAISQLLLAIKAERTAEMAIEAHRANEKPVIALDSTLGSFLAEHTKFTQTNVGDELRGFDYRVVLSRLLRRTRRISIKDKKGKKGIPREIELHELPAIVRYAYEQAMELIEAMDADIPASPIDLIRHRVEQAGLTVKEVTGRDLRVEYGWKDAKGNEKPILRKVPLKERKGRVDTVAEFNNGKLDVIIMNVAGSTGISMHAAPKFKDKRPRRMIVAQAALDINVFMQMLGRINRNGQTELPLYRVFSTALPAEKRPNAVLSNKMKKLNANTSSNEKSSTSVDATDLMNKYGDEVIARYLDENPEVNRFLRVDYSLDPDNFNVDGVAKAATGRLALMPVAVQQEFYDRVESEYVAYIEYLTSVGQNELIARDLPFDAELITSTVLHEGDPTSDSPFLADAHLGKYSVKKLGKPPTAHEVNRAIEESLEGKTHDEVVKGMLAPAEAKFASLLKEQAAEIEAKYAKLSSAEKNMVRKDPLTGRHEIIAGPQSKEAEAYNAAVVRFETMTDRKGQLDWLLTKKYRIGNSLRVKVGEDAYQGVITAIKMRWKEGSPGNPFVPGGFNVTIMVNGGVRRITLPISRLQAGDTTAANSVDNPDIEFMFRRNEMEEHARETRYIVTGNLLAAYGEMTRNGEIIRFTLADGTVKEGMLMPKSFTPEANLKQELRLQDARAAAEFFGEWGRDPDVRKFGLSTRDQSLRVKSRSGGGLELSATGSVAKGGKWWKNTKLTDLIGTEFAGPRGVKTVDVPPEKVLAVLEFIFDEAPLYALKSMQDKVKDYLKTSRPSPDGSPAAFFSRARGDVQPPRSEMAAPTFYSQMQRVLESKLPGSGSAMQIRNTIQAFAKKGEFKTEELEWSGVEEWLGEQGVRKVTKAEVLDFLRANEIQVQDVVKGDAWAVYDQESREEYYFETEAEARAYATENDIASVDVFPKRGVGSNDTKFDQYQLPGGQNYRELLLTLPEKPGVRGPKGWGDTHGGTYDSANFISGHWDTTNVLAHVRFNERTDADGKRVLFIEEVQSDWHQKGRKSGYLVPGMPRPRNFAAWMEENRPSATEERVHELFRDHDSQEYREWAAEYEDRTRGGISGVPDAPFKTTWPMLAMKRMIRYAAENGFDRIAWTTGEIQADRYDLSNQVASIAYMKKPNGRYHVVARRLDNQGDVELGGENTIADLEGKVGKEIAQKIADGAGEFTGGDMTVLSGVDLKVGGEGMRGFYDKILPNEVGKYVKKWGAKVGMSEVMTDRSTLGELSTSESRRLEELRSRQGSLSGLERDELSHLTDVEKSVRVKIGRAGAHSVDITPAMRDAAMQGQPLYSRKTKAGQGRHKVLADQSTATTLNNALVSYGLGDAWRNAYEAVELPDALSGFREAFQAAFGRDVRAVVPTSERFDIFNGVYIKEAPRSVYVNINSNVGFVQVAGHELWHAIQRARPDLIEWYREQSRQYYRNIPEYVEKLNKLIQPGETAYTNETAESELEADFLGDSLADPVFLKKLAESNPSKFKGLLNYIRIWLANVIGRLRGLDSQAYVNDVRALQAYLIDVLNAFAEGKDVPGNGGAAPLFSRQKSPHDPQLQSLLNKIGKGPEKPLAERIREGIDGDWRGRAADLRDRLAQASVDQFHGLKSAEKALGLTDHDRSAYIAARLSTSVDSQLMVALMKGPLRWLGNRATFVPGKKGLLDILQPVEDKMDLWEAYMVARRAERLMAEGRENWLSNDDIQRGLQLGDQYPVFKTVAADWAAFNRTMLDFAQDAGLIDVAARKLWENDDYIPFYRIMDDDKAKGPKGRRGLSHQNSGVRMLRGGKAQLNDILENMIMNTAHLIEASMKNHAVRMAVNNMMDTGLMTPAPFKFEKELIPMSQLKPMLVERGVPPDIIDSLPPDMLEGIQKLWALKAPTDKHVIKAMIDGKPKFYYVHDELLLRSLTSIDQQAWGQFMELFRAPKRWLTTLVTADPAFQAANFVRDTLQAFVLSRENITPILSGLKGARKALKKSDEYWEMLAAGGGFHSGFVNAHDPGSSARIVKAEMRHKDFKTTVLDSPRKLWDRWMEFGSAIENANRLAVYEGTVKAGKSKLSAAYEAKDFMDFSLRGDHPIFNFLAQTVPFFNARLQGIYRLGRGMAENPASFATRGMLIAFASLALWALNKDDDRYKDLEEWDKDTYWHFWHGDKHWRFPKPFEVGFIFGTIPERIFDAAYQKEDESGKRLMERMAWNVWQVFNLGALPQTVAPIVEQVANRDFFRGAPIVGLRLERLAPEAQFGPWTHETSIQLGRALGVSPARIDHLLQGYFGTIGDYALEASDWLVRRTWDFPAEPATQAQDLPVVKRFYRGETERASRYSTEFYDLFRELDKTYNTIREYAKTGDRDRARALMDEKGAELVPLKMLRRANAQLQKISKEARLVHLNRMMTPEEKRARLDALEAMRNAIYKEAVTKARAATR